MEVQERQAQKQQQEKNQHESLIDKILNGIDGLTVLEVNTIVGDFEATADHKLNRMNGAPMIASRINLIQGDISTAMSENFLESPYDQLREYHNIREQQAHQIVERNVNVLKSLIALTKEALDSKNEIARKQNPNNQEN